MSAAIVMTTFIDLEGVDVVLVRRGRVYNVADTAKLFGGCKHDNGFTAEKVEPDLYAWVCNHHCGFSSASHPTDPTAVRYVRHTPGPEDKTLPPVDWKAGEH